MDPAALFQALQVAMDAGDSARIQAILADLGRFSPQELSARGGVTFPDAPSGPVRPAPAGYAPMGLAPSAPNLVQPPAFDPIGSGAGLPPSVDQIKTRVPAGGPPVADTFVPKGVSQTFVRPPPGPLNVVEMPGEPVKMGAETAVRPVPKLGGPLPPTLKAPPLPPTYPPLAADLEVPKTGVRPPPVSELRASGLLSESAVRPAPAAATSPGGPSAASRAGGWPADAVRPAATTPGTSSPGRVFVGGPTTPPQVEELTQVAKAPAVAVAGAPPSVGARVLSAVRPLVSKLGTLGTAVGVGADTVGLIRAADSARDPSAAPIENLARGAAGVAGAFRPQPPPTREEMLADPAAAMRRQQSAAMGADTPIVRHLNPTAIAARAGDALSGLAQKGIEWAIARPGDVPGPQFDMEADVAANMPSPFSVGVEDSPVSGGGSFRMSGVSDAPSGSASSAPVRPRVKGKGGQRGPSPIPSSPAMPGPAVPPGPMEPDANFRLSYSPEVMKALGLAASSGGPVRPGGGQAAPGYAGVNIAALQRPAELEGQRLPLTQEPGGVARHMVRPLDLSAVEKSMGGGVGSGLSAIGKDLSTTTSPSPFLPRPSVGGSVSGLPVSKTRKSASGVTEVLPLDGEEDDLEGLQPGRDSAVRNQIRRDRESKRRN